MNDSAYLCSVTKNNKQYDIQIIFTDGSLMRIGVV